jgi:hypothetical protein
MPYDLPHARQYLAPAADSFWEWRDGGDVVAWRHGGDTIAFRAEFAEVLRRLVVHGLPHFDAVVLFLAACRSPAKIGEVEIEKCNVLPSLTARDRSNWRYRDLLLALEAISAISWSVRSRLEGKIEMAAMLFETAYMVESPQGSASLLEALEGCLPEEIYFPNPQRRDVDGLARLASLAAGAHRIAPDRLPLRQQTGLEQLPEPQPVDAPPAESLRALLARLENDEELGGLARLARNLMAVLTLPRRMSETEDLPLGGVSDITNRGSFDRLLVSELAHDDMTFTVRVALSEALYLRREAPPNVPPQRRLIMIDCGLRMWGLPRIFATAAALALAVPRARQAETAVYRARGTHLDLVDLASREGLVAHLSALEPEAHPGSALGVFRRLALDGEGLDEAVLITGLDVLADRGFQKCVSEMELPVLYIVAVGRDGELRLMRRGAQGTKVLREIHCRLEDILPARPHVTPLINRDCDPLLPAILRLNQFPLRLPHPIDPARVWSDGESGALSLTTDGRLMHWYDRGVGARQLSDTIPRGALHWHDHRRTGQSVMSAVVGRLPQRELYLLQISLETKTCRTISLMLGHFNPRHVAAHAGALFVIYGDRVEVFSLADGEPLGSQDLPKRTKWLRDRFFHSSDGWHALSFNGSTAQFEKVCDSQFTGALQLLAPFDIAGVDGPAYLTAHGEVRFSVDTGLKTAAPTAPFSAKLEPVLISGPSEPAIGSERGLRLQLPAKPSGGPFRVAAIAADGQRIVLSPQKTPDRRGACILLDLRTGDVKWFSRDPAMALARNLLDRIYNRSSLRHNFEAVVVEGTQLTLVGTGSRNDCRIAFDPAAPKFLLQPTTVAPESKRIRFVATAGPRGTRYRLSVAEWPDGSRAYLDSRGMLHLKSADLRVPELTLVLTECPLAGWCANRGVFGPSYFSGTPDRADADLYTNIYQYGMREFVLHLQ